MASKKQWKSAPEMVIDPQKTYTATLATEKGDITIELLVKAAPQTVNNFVFLAREGFYEDVIFHRTIQGFMIQGGDPTGTGSGGPGYKFKDEPVTLPYKRGIVAMANAGPNTNGSQFFIMHQDYALAPNYTIFGRVTSGMEVVDTIITAPAGAQDRPRTPVRITGMTITEA